MKNIFDHIEYCYFANWGIEQDKNFYITGWKSDEYYYVVIANPSSGYKSEARFYIEGEIKPANPTTIVPIILNISRYKLPDGRMLKQDIDYGTMNVFIDFGSIL